MQPPIVPASLAGVVFQVLTLGQPPLVVGLLLVAALALFVWRSSRTSPG